jgi:hypothetical protein
MACGGSRGRKREKGLAGCKRMNRKRDVRKGPTRALKKGLNFGGQDIFGG